jgi:hypothetical protein
LWPRRPALVVNFSRICSVFNTSLARLRLVGILEGLSFLVLLGMLFFLAVVQVAVERRWPLTRIVLALAASVLPFGPFVLDARLLRRELEAEAQAAPQSVTA